MSETATFKCGCLVMRDALSKRVYSISACATHTPAFQAARALGQAGVDALLIATATTTAELETAFEIRRAWKGDTR